MLPKGQQKLTKFSDLIEEDLSYLQLFLELPETSWLLQNVLYIYMRPKAKLGNTKPDPRTHLTCFFIYIQAFEATRRFLEALKIAGDS